MIGTPRVHHRLVDSTNLRARALASAGAPHGTVVTATEQSAGRGRSDRSWHAPAASSVLMSLIVRGRGEDAALLPLAAAVALCDVLEPYLGDVAIKWPNDVWVARRKIAGILVEGRPHDDWAVLGMGVNVNTAAAELPEGATSVSAAGAPRETVDGTLAALFATLHTRLAQPRETVLAAWRRRDALTGGEVSWPAGRGIAAGIDSRGALLVDTPEGRIALDAGEVHLGWSGPAPG